MVVVKENGRNKELNQLALPKKPKGGEKGKSGLRLPKNLRQRFETDTTPQTTHANPDSSLRKRTKAAAPRVRRKKVEFASTEAIVKSMDEAEKTRDPKTEEVEAKMMQLKREPQRQLEALLDLEHIHPIVFMHLVGEEQQLVGLSKLHYSNDFDRWWHDGDYLLKHAASPRVKAEIAKEFPLKVGCLREVMKELKGQPEMQIEILQVVGSIHSAIFSQLGNAEAQRIAIGKIDSQAEPRRFAATPSELLSCAMTNELKVEIAERFPIEFPLIASQEIIRANGNPALQLALIKSTKKIYPTAFCQISTEEGQREAAKKLGYPSKDDVVMLHPNIRKALIDELAPSFSSAYRKSFSQANLRKQALTKEIAELIRIK